LCLLSIINIWIDNQFILILFLKLAIILTSAGLFAEIGSCKVVWQLTGIKDQHISLLVKIFLKFTIIWERSTDLLVEIDILQVLLW